MAELGGNCEAWYGTDFCICVFELMDEFTAIYEEQFGMMPEMTR